MASSLAEIDDQLSELGDVPEDVDAMVARYGDGDRSLSHVDALLADLESGVQLAAVPAMAVAHAAPAQDPQAEAPSDESDVDEPQSAASASDSNDWDPDSALLDGPEWTTGASDETADAVTGEVAISDDRHGDSGEDSGEVEASSTAAAAAQVESHPSETPARRRPRKSRDTIVDSPASGAPTGDAQGDDTPITGEFLVDDGPAGTAGADDYLDDELDDILGGDEAGDDDVTTIASVDMVAKAADAADAADAEDATDDVEDATGEDNDSFEMLIDDDEIELIDEDELEVLDDDDE